MGKGHIKTPVTRACHTCGTDFIGKHYASKYCSKICANKNQYARNRTKELNKGYKLWKTYKITLEQYEEMAEKQDYSCAICQRKPNILYVDHCHNSGQIRGLLCMNCNTALGHFQDNKETLDRAIQYLEIAEIKKVRGAA